MPYKTKKVGDKYCVYKKEMVTNLVECNNNTI